MFQRARAAVGHGSDRYTHGVDLLRVQTDELDTLADKCEAMANRLSGVSAAPSAGPSHQATTAAANMVHTGIIATTASLVVRLQATAAKLRSAGACYDEQDAGSAGRIDAAGRSMEA